MEFGKLFPPFLTFQETAHGLKSVRSAGEIVGGAIQTGECEELLFALLHGFQLAFPLQGEANQRGAAMRGILFAIYKGVLEQTVDENLNVLARDGTGAGELGDSLRTQTVEAAENATAAGGEFALKMNRGSDDAETVKEGSGFFEEAGESGAGILLHDSYTVLLTTYLSIGLLRPERQFRLLSGWTTDQPWARLPFSGCIERYGTNARRVCTNRGN